MRSGSIRAASVYTSAPPILPGPLTVKTALCHPGLAAPPLIDRIAEPMGFETSWIRQGAKTAECALSPRGSRRSRGASIVCSQNQNKKPATCSATR
jgi:hypothetical protein